MIDPHMRAGWFSRCVAFFYDLVYVTIALLLISIFTTLWMLFTAEIPTEMEVWDIREYLLEHYPQMFIINRIIQAIAAISYFFVFPIISSEHRTLGMLTAGISLMNEVGEEVTRKQYLARELLKWILFPGFILAFKKEKQALHDKITNCYVVIN